MNTRSTRSSTSNVSGGTCADSVALSEETAKNVGTTDSGKLVGTKGKKCSSSHEDLSETESITDTTGRRSTRLGKAGNSKETTDNPSAMRSARSSRSQDLVANLEKSATPGRKTSDLEETIVDSSPKSRRSRARKTSETESIESTSSVSTRRSSARIRKVSETDSIESTSNITTRRSTARTRKVSETESIESTSSISTRKSTARTRKVSETESIESTASNSGRRYSTRSRRADDFDDAIETPVYTSRRSSSRLSQASGMGSTENLTVTDKTCNTTRVGTRLSKIEEYVEFGENSNIRMKTKEGKGNDLDKTFPSEESSSASVPTQCDVSSASAKVSDIKPSTSRRSSRVNKDSVVDDNKQAVEEPLTPRRSSTRLGKEADSTDSKEKSVRGLFKDEKGIGGKVSSNPLAEFDILLVEVGDQGDKKESKEDESVTSSQNSVENEINSVNPSSEIIKADLVDESARIITPKRQNDSSNVRHTPLDGESKSADNKRQSSEFKHAVDSNVSVKRRSMRRENLPLNNLAQESKNSGLSPAISSNQQMEALSPRHSPGAVKPNSQRSTLSPVVKLVDCQKENVPDGNLLNNDNVDALDSQEGQPDKMTNETSSPKITAKNASVKVDNIETVLLSEQKRGKHSPTKKVGKEQDSNNSTDSLSSTLEITESTIAVSESNAHKIISGKATPIKHQIEASEAESMCQKKIESPQVRKRRSDISKEKDEILEIAANNSVDLSPKISAFKSDKKNSPRKSVSKNPSPSKHEVKANERNSVCQTKTKSPLTRSRRNSVFDISDFAKDEDTLLEKMLDDFVDVVTDTAPKSDEGSADHHLKSSSDDSKVSNVGEPPESSEKKINDARSADELAQDVEESISIEGIETVCPTASRSFEQGEVNIVTKRNKAEGAVEEDQGIEVSDDSEVDPLEDSDTETVKLIDLKDSDDDIAVVDNDSNHSSDTINSSESTSESAAKDNLAENNSKSQRRKSIMSDKSSDVLVEEVSDSDDPEKTKDCGNSSEASDDTSSESNEASNVETNAKIGEKTESHSISLVDLSEKEAPINNDKLNSVLVDKNDPTQKQVTFCGEVVNSKVKSSIKPSSKDLNDPEYVIKLNSYINDVLSSRQKSKEISKIVKYDPSKSYKTNNILKSKSNPIKISDECNERGNKKIVANTNKVSELLLTKSKVSSERNERENKKNVVNTNKVSELLLTKSKVSSERNERENEKNVANTKKVSELLLTKSKVSSERNERENKKNVANTNKVSELFPKKSKVDIKETTVQDGKKPRDSELSQKSGIVAMCNPISNRNKSTSANVAKNSVQKKLSEKPTTQALKESSVKRKFEEEVLIEKQLKQSEKFLPAKSLDLPKTSKKFKSKHNQNNLEHLDQNTSLGKTVPKMDFSVSENDPATGVKLNKISGKSDKNSKSSLSGKSDKGQLKEVEGSKSAGLVRTTWGKISVDSNLKKLGTIGKRKIIDPANKWQIKTASADAASSAVSAAKKLKTSCNFVVTPSVPKTKSSLAHDSNNKPNVTSVSHKTDESKQFSTYFSPFPKGQNQTQQNVIAIKPTVHDLKLKPYVEVEGIQKKKKKKRKNKDLISKAHKTEEIEKTLTGSIVSQAPKESHQIPQNVTAIQPAVQKVPSLGVNSIPKKKKKKKKNKDFGSTLPKTEEPKNTSSSNISQSPKKLHQKQQSSSENNFNSRPVLKVESILTKKNKNENLTLDSRKTEKPEITCKSLNNCPFPKELHKTEQKITQLKFSVNDSKSKTEFKASDIRKKKKKNKKNKTNITENSTSSNLMKALVNSYSDRSKPSASKKSFFKFSDSAATPSSKVEESPNAEVMKKEKKVVPVKSQVNDFKLLGKARKLDVQDMFFKNKTLAAS